jgi:hypothetical protein
MRELVGIFGLVCGAVVVWTVANYGYSSADDPSVKWNMAFLFAVIATGGLFGHAVSVRLWHRSRFWSVIVGLACAGALLINLSNSLGALAGKDSRSTAEAATKSTQIRDDRAELARLQKALDAIGPYTPTDEAAVSAAKRAADAATKSREAECGTTEKQRGNNCRAREADERKANEDLAKATGAKASTNRANRLEAQMQPVRDRLAKAGPIAATNVQGNALAKLFRLPDAEAGFMATLQQFGLAAVVEILIVLSMVSFELMAPRTLSAKVIEPAVKPEAPKLSAEALFDRPRLVASNPENPVGSVKRILTESLETAKGAKVELAELANRYRAVCKAQSKRACSLEMFTGEVAAFCETVGIKRKTEGEHLYLVDVQLVRMRGEAAV